ncbi:MAG TPA: peptidoglycan DD-metalloendopeptidase family protein [Paludibacteraceae bacterium]|nr:peptidoglycan DD-metalloendopeptidase family protein [Paludibacteraceae bacterium]HPH62976.1 peptidoglycan DD-metalloendopeptidase family protein [Paludibacteraceae bacterium]
MKTFKLILILIALTFYCSINEQYSSIYANPSKKSTQTTQRKTTKTSQKSSKSKTTEEINNLKNKQQTVKQNVKEIDKSLTENRQSTKISLKQLERLNHDIKNRSQVIENQGKEIKNLEGKITDMNQDLDYMLAEYNYMKRKYVELIYHAYVKQNNRNRLLFILSASSFQEAYRRFDYLNKFASMRRQQAESLEQSRVNLDKKKQDIEQAKLESEKLLKNHENEKKELLVQKEKQNQVVTSLQEREKELKKELKEQQRLSEELNGKIQDLIAKQAKESAERAKKKQATKAKTKGGYAMTKTETIVSGGFEKKQGNLAWPVNGMITGRFGRQVHPVLKHVTTDNKGIYITAVSGSDAKAVYDGIVTQRFSVPGSNNAIIVRHGNFLSVYANLTKIYINVGDKVNTGDKIGKIFEDPDDKYRATLFFQIWKEKDLQNPEKWLRTK